MQFEGYKKVILLDSVISGHLDIGSVVVFKEEDILSRSQNFYLLHGINLPEALDLCKNLSMPLPSQILLIGIEIGRADEFGEILSDELHHQLEDIYRNVMTAISNFL